MNYSRALIVAVTLGIGAGSAVASAEPETPEKSGQHRFPLDLQAVEQRNSERFDAADSNGDELLSLAEFQTLEPKGKAGKRKGRRAHGARLRGRSGDVGGVRGLSDEERAERRAAHHASRASFDAKMFAALDKDGDGSLSPEESSRENRQAAKRALVQAHVFKELDVDSDGSVTRGEFSSQLERLRQADADNDGEISRAEAKALRRDRWRDRRGA